MSQSNKSGVTGFVNCLACGKSFPVMHHGQSYCCIEHAMWASLEFIKFYAETYSEFLKHLRSRFDQDHKPSDSLTDPNDKE